MAALEPHHGQPCPIPLGLDQFESATPLQPECREHGPHCHRRRRHQRDLVRPSRPLERPWRLGLGSLSSLPARRPPLTVRTLSIPITTASPRSNSLIIYYSPPPATAISPTWRLLQLHLRPPSGVAGTAPSLHLTFHAPRKTRRRPVLPRSGP